MQAIPDTHARRIRYYVTMPAFGQCEGNSYPFQEDGYTLHHNRKKNFDPGFFPTGLCPDPDQNSCFFRVPPALSRDSARPLRPLPPSPLSMSAQTAERERALRQLADICSKDIVFARCTSFARLTHSGSCTEVSRVVTSSSDVSEVDLQGSDGLITAHGNPAGSVPASPCSHAGTPTANRLGPLIRPNEIKRRNRKRQVPGETQTDTRRLAKRARARLNAQLRLQQVMGDALHCRACGATNTPEWRRGPDGQKSLCNACGLHFAKIVRVERERQELEAREAAMLPAVRITAVVQLLN